MEENKKLRKIFAFVNECENEVNEILAEIRKKERIDESMQGLYIEVYNFAEEEMPKLYRAMYKNETLSFGTDFGKNFHQLVLKRKELMMKNGGTIKINGEIIENVPEINIIEVGA